MSGLQGASISTIADGVDLCSLCNGGIVNPTSLNCGHAFCHQCLRVYVDTGSYAESVDFPCPHCGRLSAPPWGIWHLSQKPLERSHDELYETWRFESMCDLCASNGLYATAGSRCQQCDANLCHTCAYTHKLVSSTVKHTIVTDDSKISKGSCSGSKENEGKVKTSSRVRLTT